MSIQIIYDSKTIDLLIDNDALLTNYMQQRQQHRSASGKIETINQYGIQKISFASIFDEDTYEDLLAWWSFARQGELWAFAFDSGNAISTTLRSAAAAGQTTIELTDCNFVDGSVCLIKSGLDDKFEIVVVGPGGFDFIVDESGNYLVDESSNYVVSGYEIIASANLKFSYVAGDIFRHYDYWPQVISVDKFFEPKRENDYYKYIFNFTELN